MHQLGVLLILTQSSQFLALSYRSIDNPQLPVFKTFVKIYTGCCSCKIKNWNRKAVILYYSDFMHLFSISDISSADPPMRDRIAREKCYCKGPCVFYCKNQLNIADF